ncbi:MAG: methylmalonyl-CoA mutase subunit beta [Flavobacteriaceae bacterium]
MQDHDLFPEFSKVSAQQWKQQIQYDLKGADYNDTLVWESPEGIKVKPFYTIEDLPSHPMPSQKADWKIGHHIKVQGMDATRTMAQGLVAQGVESLVLEFPERTDMAMLLRELAPKVPIHCKFGFLPGEDINTLLEVARDTDGPLYLNLDLLGQLTRTGNWFTNQALDHEQLEAMAQKVGNGPLAGLLGVDMTHYQNAGAHTVQQLAYGLAHAHEYLAHFSERVPEVLALPMVFHVAVGPHYFFEIAKLRALRLLWKNLCAAYDLETPCHIVAQPSLRNKTLYDFNMNMLRTTSECMAAVLGGADTICNSPYDTLFNAPNDFGDRIAKNQLLLLRHEAHLVAGQDPVQGTYYLESLVQQQAKKAWELFQQLEQGGGFLAQLKKGNIQRKIRESAQREQQLFDAQETILVGTNKYPNTEEKAQGSFGKKRRVKTLLEPIVKKRLAATTEQKRLENE